MIYRHRGHQQAVKEKLWRVERSRLAIECGALNPAFAQTLTEEGFTLEPENGQNSKREYLLG